MSSTQKLCTFAVLASSLTVSNGFAPKHPNRVSSISPAKLTPQSQSLPLGEHATGICPCAICYGSSRPTKLRSRVAESDEVELVTDEVFTSQADLLSLIDDLSAADALDDDEEVVSERNEAGQLALSAKNIDKRTLELLAKKGITHMTPIQEESFDPIFEGRDIIGRSRTGTGKTLAFCLPIIQALAQSESIDTRERGRSPKVICLLPTRELARQVEEQLDAIMKPHRYNAECFYGGTSYVPQERAIRNGIDVLVATPGRMLDHLRKGNLDLSDVEYAILDEADEMLNMGFSDDVEEVFSYFDVQNAQVLLFSATTPPWVAKMARSYLKDPISIDAVKGDESRLATTVRHIGMEVGSRMRAQVLEDIISVHGKDKRVIVFADTKKDCDDICTHSFKTLAASQLHGDMTQKLRDATLQQFKLGKFQVLVATDVAARGLDISGVDLVLQMSPPRDEDTYVHRSGRTGRAGRSGLNIVLHSADEAFRIRRLQKELNFRVERGALPSTQQVMESISELASQSLETVEDEVIPYFLASSEKLLAAAEEKGDRQAIVNLLARSLAAVSGKKSIERRSILTGEADKLTVSMKSDNPLVVGDVFWAINRISNRGEHFNNDIGKVELGLDPTHVVFDMDITAAEALIQTSKENQLKSYTFEITEALPPLNRRNEQGGRGGRGRGGGRGGRGGYNGRGSYGGNSRGRGRSYGGDRRSYGGDRRSSYGGGGRPSYGDASRGGNRDQPYRREFMR